MATNHTVKMTVRVDDSLYFRVKDRAAADKQTLVKFVDQALRIALILKRFRFVR